MLPGGCWGGLVGVEPVPGWFWAPGVPGVFVLVAAPGRAEAFELSPLGVEVRSGPAPDDVEGVVVGVLGDGAAVLDGVDRSGFGLGLGLVVLGF